MPDIKYITLVDDHAMFRKGLASLINFFPTYKVLFDAANGKDFITQLKPPHLPDIVLLDITMPEMDGYATAEWIRVNYPGIKIIALSTMDSETAIIKMIRHGACGYVLKDAEPAELKNAFDEVLSKGFFYNDMVTRKILQSIHQLGAGYRFLRIKNTACIFHSAKDGFRLHVGEFIIRIRRNVTGVKL